VDAPPPQLGLVREAIAALAAEPADQSSMWRGAIVTDELALDFENAHCVLPLLRSAGVVFEGEAAALMAELDALLTATPESSLWSDEALRWHPTWARARVVARRLLMLPPLASEARQRRRRRRLDDEDPDDGATGAPRTRLLPFCCL
jgi:hypothetical protein